MIFYVYRLTNIHNGKVYIGVHQTNNINDGYMGSGVLLKNVRKKYGAGCFQKEILSYHDDRDSMLAEESRLVTEEFCRDKNNYNINVGGAGPSDAYYYDPDTYHNSSAHIENVKAAAKRGRISSTKLKKTREVEYYKSPNLCYCGNIIEYGVRNINKYCSMSCSAIKNNIGRVITDEQKEKTRQTLLEKTKDSKTAKRRKRREKLARERAKEIEEIRNKIINSTIKTSGRGWKSKIAREVGLNPRSFCAWTRCHMPKYHKEHYGGSGG